MLIIGHRGAAGYCTENTLLSIRRAIDLRVDMVEVDVQATRDGHLVIFHDKLIDRLANSTGYLGDYTLEELQQIELRNHGKIPSFHDVCKLIAETNSALLIEIISLGIERTVWDVLRKNLPTDQFIIASFHHTQIKHVKEFDDNVRTAALIEGTPVNLESTIRASDCDFIAFGFDSISQDAICRSQNLGIKVLAWTIDDPREIRRAQALGIEGIVTNFPDIARRSLRVEA